MEDVVGAEAEVVVAKEEDAQRGLARGPSSPFDHPTSSGVVAEASAAYHVISQCLDEVALLQWLPKTLETAAQKTTRSERKRSSVTTLRMTLMGALGEVIPALTG